MAKRQEAKRRATETSKSPSSMPATPQEAADLLERELGIHPWREPVFREALDYAVLQLAVDRLARESRAILKAIGDIAPDRSTSQRIDAILRRRDEIKNVAALPGGDEPE